MSNLKTLKIGMEFIPEKVDSLKVGSVADYYILLHLLRPLVTFDDFGNIKGELASSWKISKDFKTYTFEINNTAFFSDGSKIVAKDVITTFQRGIKSGESVHFNFKKIKDVREDSASSFTIEFYDAEKYFLYDLIHPELRVLHFSDYQSVKFGSQKFDITSGAYRIDSKVSKKGEYHLISNKYFSSKMPDFPKILIKWPKYESGFENTVNNESFDIIWNSTSFKEPSETDLERMGFKFHRPRLSFTFWVSINSDGPNKLLLENRAWLVANVLENKKKIFNSDARNITYAEQLYLPNGPGRPSGEELDQYRAKLALAKKLKPKKMKLLLSSRLINKENLIEFLKGRGIGLEVVYYNTFSEYQGFIEKDSFDFIQVNNDFSYPNLRNSLNVTLNEKRPLVFVSKNSEVRGLLKDLNSQDIPELRNKKVREIGLSFMNNYDILPLFYHHSLVYHRSNIDFSGWSTVYPDISSWKLKILKK